MSITNKQTLEFTFLSEHVTLIPIVAKWHQDEWQHISPEQTIESRIKAYSTYSTYIDIPNCILALSDNMPVGTASLVEADMDTHAHLGPWLASVYVPQSHRCKGIASQLIKRCIDNARELGIKRLYLFTPDAIEFYKKRGWVFVESCLYHNEKVDIMRFHL